MATGKTNDQVLIREYIKSQQKTSQFPSESAYFEFLAASQFLKEHDLSDEEIEAGLTGGDADGGCDGVYLFFNDMLISEDSIENLTITRESILQLFIIQAKNELRFSEDVIMKWKTTSSNLLQFDNELELFSKRYSEFILNFFQRFKDLRIKLLTSKVKLSFNYIYVSVADEVHPNVQAQSNELCDLIHQLFPGPMTDVKVSFIGASQLMDLVNTPASQHLSLTLADNPIALGFKTDYVALVKLGNYFKFITDEDEVLRKNIFESNVRDYQGHNNVNNEIRDTLSASTTEDFWWLNNGVTIIAEEISPTTSKRLLVINPEIVNGLQTSNEIYQYFTLHPEMIEKEERNLLVRLMVPNDEGSRDRIILATNSQTVIPAVALRSTDPIHRQIETYFKARGLYYDRRKNYYKNQGKRASEIVSIGFLGQCLMSLFMGKPNYARARPSTLLNSDENYKKLYVDISEVDVFYRVASLGKKVEHFIKSSGEYEQSAKSNILFYTLYAVAALAVHSVDISVKSFKELNENVFNNDSLAAAARIVFDLYKELGGNDKVAKGNVLLEKLRCKITSMVRT